MDQVRNHWHLTTDPFASGAGPYVASPTHDEACARLVHAIEAGEKRVTLRSPSGLGKTVVLNRVLAAIRATDLKIARSTATDSGSLIGTLADALGSRQTNVPNLSDWRRLADAATLCRIQGQRILFAIDDVMGETLTPQVRGLAAVDSHSRARITVVEVGRELEEDGREDDWSLKIRLSPLTRSETGNYVARKLASADRREPTFTPQAVTRLHAISAGIPRGIDRLAGLALLASASRSLEMVTPEVVEGVASECVLPRSA